MSDQAVKCRKCNNITKNSNGLCYLHQTQSASVSATNRIPMPKIHTSEIANDRSSGWLSHETGISLPDYASEESIFDLDENEQFSKWMKARVSVRAIESTFQRKGSEAAHTYASGIDDTSLALIWERMDSSAMSEFGSPELRTEFVSIIQSQVETRVNEGSFHPLDTKGYIQEFANSDEPRSAATFF
jgi:hypothetical protein